MNSRGSLANRSHPSLVVVSGLLCLAIASFLSVRAANPAPVGQWPGYSRGAATDILVRSNLVYLAAGQGGLIIADVSNPAKPMRVGAYDTPGWAGRVRLDGKLAYVADGPGGLQILDVSNPAKPVFVGHSSTDEFAGDLDLIGQFAYVADPNLGLQIIDVGDPARPMRVRIVNDAHPGAARVNLAGATAYVAIRGDLRAYDVSDPANPTKGNGFYTFSGPSWIRGFTVAGNYAYLVNDNLGFGIVDLGNNQREVGYRRLRSSPYSVQVAGNLAYVANGIDGLQIFDISNPADPINVGGYAAHGDLVGVQTVGKLAYVATSVAYNAVSKPGFEIIDVSNPADPKPVGSFDSSGSNEAVQRLGDLAYVADGDAGLKILDVSNPASPALLGQYDLSGSVHAVQVVGSLAYVAAETAGLQVLDVSDSTNPTPVGGSDWIRDVRDIQVVGNRAYAVGFRSGLHVFDLSNPTKPTWQGSLALATGSGPGSYQGLQVVGHLAYWATGTDLRIIDVSDPATPTLVQRFNTGGKANDVYVVGNLAYVANDAAGLQILDVSNPTSLVRVGVHATHGFARKVQVVGKLAYVTEAPADSQFEGFEPTGGLRLIDVGDPTQPVEVGGYDTAGEANDIQVVGKLAYVADGSAGLQVFDVNACRLAPVIRSNHGAGEPTFTVTGEAGIAYVLERSSGLSAGSNWTAVSTNTVTASPLIITDSTSTDGRPQFYRLRQLP